jgi:hypothetical protein
MNWNIIKKYNLIQSLRNLRRVNFEKKVKHAILNFFNYFDDTTTTSSVSIADLQITDLRIKEKKEVVVINIVLCRPALLIGKKGETINNLVRSLRIYLNKNVEIKIVESKLWD